MTSFRIAQYGTKHGHAAGKLAALRSNPAVELAGLYEPDPQRRAELATAPFPFAGVRWFDDPAAFLSDPTVVAVAAEGANYESLVQTEAIVRAGKHVWYDKPAGEDWARWQRVMAQAKERGLIIQMGYMFRYHHAFRRIAGWVKSGLLGDIFAIRAHMSTWLAEEQRRRISRHRGGIFYDLAGHVLDQILWLLGRPEKITSFLRHDGDLMPGFADNTLVVLEFAGAMACVDIAAMETRPMARRFEVYGRHGSAILEPFEPATAIRLCLETARDGFQAGEQIIPVEPQSRQHLYELELDAYLETIRGHQAPDRSSAHELLVQETLLRAVGILTD